MRLKLPEVIQIFPVIFRQNIIPNGGFRISNKILTTALVTVQLVVGVTSVHKQQTTRSQTLQVSYENGNKITSTETGKSGF